MQKEVLLIDLPYCPQLLYTTTYNKGIDTSVETVAESQQVNKPLSYHYISTVNP